VPLRTVAMLPVSLTLLTVFSAAPGPAAACPAELFRIERSKNANVVVYEAKPGTEVTATWLMLAEHGERAALTFLERTMAYGFDLRSAAPAPGSWLTLHALASRVIHVTEHGGCLAALASIGGHAAVLKRIYVKADDRGLIPTVQFVRLFGVDVATGAALTETLRPGEGR